MARPKAPAPLASPDETEQQFYDALQHADIERLMAVWSDDEEICCVHPGGPRVVGASAIRAGFTAIFANGAINAQPENIQRLQSGACAVHSVIERVRRMAPEGPQSAWVVATNVYLKTAQGWRLVSHHASVGPAREMQDFVEAASVLH